MSSLSKRLFKSIFSRKSKNKVVPISDEFTDLSKISEEEEQLEEKEQLLEANQLEVIPQIDGTCWFNGILMALLYSEGIRKVIYKETLKWTQEEIQEDKFKGFVVYVLKYNYKDPEKIRELFKRRFKTSSLLLSLLKRTPLLVEVKEVLKRKLNKYILNIGYSITLFLLNTRFLDIFFGNKNDYLSIYYYSTDYILNYINNDNLDIEPKIIFLYHYEFINKDIINEITKKQLTNVTQKILYNIQYYEHFIIINGIRYKLDACIISNNNFEAFKNTHIISGITYKYKPYIYNGWTMVEEQKTKIKPYIKEPRYSCPLFDYDWKEKLTKRNAGFCISEEECKLLDEDKTNLCFNFNKETYEIVFVYVRMDDSNDSSLTSLESGIRPENLQFTSRSLSSIEQEFYKIDEKTLNELKEQLINIEYIERRELEQFEIDFRRNKYNIFYFMLFNKRLQDEIKKGITLEEILIKIYRELLKVFIKTNSKIYKLPILTDNLIFNHLSIERIKKILGIIGYNETEIEEIYEKSDNYLIIWYLINDKQETDKEHLLFLIMRLYIMYNKKLKVEELSDIRFIDKFNSDKIIKTRRIRRRIYDELKQNDDFLQDIFNKYEQGINKYYLLALIKQMADKEKIYKERDELIRIDLEYLFS